MKRELIDLTGKEFGLLFVLERAPNRNKTTYWKCQCSCGVIKDVRYGSMVNGRSKSCGCLRRAMINSKNPTWGGHGEISLNYFGNLKRSAQKRSFEFTITIEYVWKLFLEQDRKCALSGLELEFGPKQHEETTASIDRIESSKGYVEGNVQWVHKDVNRMKNMFDEDYFIDMCRRIAHNDETKN